MNFPGHIFKSYDIRGLVDGELSWDIAYRLGRAYVKFLKEAGHDLENNSIVVGRDMRESGDVFYPAVTKGITDEGVNVVAIGHTTTPLFNFTCAHYSAHAAGIMVTASHNPSEYNGFKLSLGNGIAVGKGNGMEKIRDLVMDCEFVDSDKAGEVSEANFLSDYFERIFSLVNIDNDRRLKVVIDAGNGMGYITFPKLLEQLPIDVEFLFLEPDGTFPNHEANPIKTETLKGLQKKVVETGADFGFALDADVDRIGLVDNNGEVVDASFVAVLIGESVLEKYPNAKMICDLRTSMIVREVWESSGAEVFSSPVGHATIKPMMKEMGAAFASELSLHLYFKDMYNVESTDLSFLYLVHLLQREGKNLSEIIVPLRKYFHSGEINFEVEDKDGMMKNLEEKYKDEALEITHLDGVKMIFDWGWVSVRKSNTEPVLRLILEARDEGVMKVKVEEFGSIIRGE